MKTFLPTVLLILTLSACSFATPQTTPPDPSTPLSGLSPLTFSYNILPPQIEPTENQAVVYASQQSNEQGLRIMNWLEYWSRCDNLPFDPAVEMRWGAIFDDPENPSFILRVIDTGEAFYAVPLRNGNWIDPPSTPCQGTMDSAYAPVLLASGADRQRISVEASTLRKQDDQGQVVAWFNMQSEQWESDFPFYQSKLYNLPASYEDLLAYPDEFVQAPDPVTERAAFDKWFLEELVPALGPVYRRQLNYHVYSGGDSITGFDAYTVPGTQPILESGSIAFFYFESAGVIYPVPCINIDRGYEGEPTYQTFCPALFDLPNAGISTASLVDLTTGARYVSEIYIYNNLSARPDIDWSETVINMVNGIGMYNDNGNWLRFGMGTIITYPVK